MRLGIAGAQHFHVFDLLAAVKKIPEIELVGICSIDPVLQKKIFEITPIPLYDSVENLLQIARPDTVACFESISRRAGVIAACISKGKNVLCDKPPASSYEQLEQLEQLTVALTGPTQPIFSAIFSERYNPPVVTLKKIVASGVIGKVVNFAAFRPHKLKLAERPAWMFERSSYGGILVDLAIHDIDVFHWLTGSRPVEITAYSSNATCPQYPGFEDNAQMLFKAEDGSTGFIKVEWLAPESFPTHGDCRYFVTGTTGTVEVSTEGDLTTKGGRVILCTQNQSPVAIPLEETSDLYADFFNAVSMIKTSGSTQHSPISVPNILAATRVALAAREAADQGKKIYLQWR